MKNESNNRSDVRIRCSGLCGRITAFGIALCFFFSVAAQAYEPFQTIYDWTDPGSDGWTNGFTGGTLSNPDGSLQLSFPKQYGMPTSQTDFMGVQVVAGQVITNLQFRFNCVNYQPSMLWVAIHSAESGRMWRHAVDIGAAGTYVDNNIAVSSNNGWYCAASTSPEDFEADMATADWLGIFVRRGGTTEAQAYKVDDFVINGYTGVPPVIIVDSDGDGIPDEWEIAHGMDPASSDDAAIDSDGDGMSNYAEYLTGTDPNDSSSVFGVGLSQSNKVDTVKGFVLEWSSIPGRKYDVLRSTNLSDGFQVFEPDITATPPKNTYNDKTATNGAAYFYKIRARQ